VTILDHPERVKAEHRGDLAETLVPVAAELAFTVRDCDREGIGRWLDERGLPVGATVTEATRAFLVTLAAMVSVDATTDQLLEWVTWDEFGQALAGATPQLPVTTAAAGDGEHGDYAAYLRHMRRGDPKEKLEDCGCAQAARDHWNDRYRQRRGGKTEKRARPADRIEDFAALRADGESIAGAARRLGLARRTAERYEARLRTEGKAPWRDKEAGRAA
jgi:hypothetical protein